MKTFFPLTIDSTILAEIASCEMSAFRRYVQHLNRGQESTDLVAGGAFAKGLEIARKNYYDHKLSTDESVTLGIQALLDTYGDHIPTKAVKTADMMAMALEQYFWTYPLETDVIQPAKLADGTHGIEYSFAHELPIQHPDLLGQNLVFVGRADMLCEYAGKLWVSDEKTTSQITADWAKQWETRGQFSAYCLTADHEVLTEKGWQTLGSLEKGIPIMCWDEGKLFYDTPSSYVELPFSENLYKVEGKISLLGTPDHRQIVWDTFTKKYKTFTLETLPKNSGSLRFISAGNKIDGVSLDENFIKLLVAIQADGCWRHDSSVEFGFKKKRKIERLRTILIDLGLEFNQYNEKDGSTTTYIYEKQEIIVLIKRLLGKDKLFNSWLLQFSEESLKTFIRELAYWDGSLQKETSWLYLTTVKTNADWVRTAAALCGHHTSEHYTQVEGHHKVCYRVVISTGYLHSVHLSSFKKQPYSGTVYCVNVPSSYFLVRHNNKIMVTGNCWGLRKDGIAVSGAYIRGIGLYKTGPKFVETVTNRSEWECEVWYQNMLQTVSKFVGKYKQYKAAQVLGQTKEEKHPANFFRPSFNESCFKYFRPCQFQDACKTLNSEGMLEMSMEQNIWLPHLHKRMPLEQFLETVRSEEI